MELRFVGFHLRFRVEQEAWLPPFIGTTIRGALGYQLRGTVCHVPRGDCETCLLRDTCVYRVLFVGHPPPHRTIMRKYPAVPQPFVILVPWRSGGQVKAGALIQVGWRLFGPAARHFPVLVYTLIEIGRKGLGPGRVPLTLVEVTDSAGKRLYQEGDSSLGTPECRTVTWPTEVAPGNGRLSLGFPTPMRLKFHERFCQRLETQALVIGLLRRMRILSYFYGEGDLAEAVVEEVHEGARAASVLADETRWVEIERTSGRQHTRMLLGGLIGRAALNVPSGLVRSLLEVGQVTHIGKATSFGFGRLEVKGG